MSEFYLKAQKPRKEVEDRFCLNCGERIRRGQMTPTKYKLRKYCDDPCREEFKRKQKSGE